MHSLIEEKRELAFPAGYEWRPARREDGPAIYATLLAANEVDQTGLTMSLEDVVREMDDPWSDPDRDSLIGLAPDGTVAAVARVFANPEPEGESRAYLDEAVHPAHRGRGLEAFVLDWLERRGRERLAEIARAHPGERQRVLRVSAAEHLPERVALFRQRGFQPVRYFFRMRRDLREPIPDWPLPEGLTLRTFSPEYSEAARQAFNETFSDHWGFEPVSPEDWEMFFMQRSSFRPDLTFLALTGDEIAGYSINRVDPEENDRTGMQAGWIGQLGVRRPWRKRGLASALVCQSMRAFRAEGLDWAVLGVDAENLTGALAIYERLGFVVFKRTVVLAKEVGPGAPGA